MSGEKGPIWRGPRAHQDRDVYRDKHATPPSGVPDFVWEDATGQVEGAELVAIRRKRPTDKRVERVEERLDKIEPALAEIRGDQKAQNVSLEFIKKHIERADKREDVLFADDVAAKKAKREAVLKVVLYLLTGGLVGKILHTLGLL